MHKKKIVYSAIPLVLLAAVVLHFDRDSEDAIEPIDTLVTTKSPNPVTANSVKEANGNIVSNFMSVEHSSKTEQVIKEPTHRFLPYSSVYQQVRCEFLASYGEELDTFENWRDFSSSDVWLEAYGTIDDGIASDLVEFKEQAVAYFLKDMNWGDVISAPHSLFFRMYARELVESVNESLNAGVELEPNELVNQAEKRLSEQYGEKVFRLLNAMGRNPVTEVLFFEHPETLSVVDGFLGYGFEEKYNFLPIGKPLDCANNA